jgi:hypothetical protein
LNLTTYGAARPNCSVAQKFPGVIRRVGEVRVFRDVLLLRVALPVVHVHGVQLVRAHRGEVVAVLGERQVERGFAVLGEDGGDARAIRGAPDVDGRAVANLRGRHHRAGGVHGERQDVVRVQVEEFLLARLRVHHHAQRRRGEHELSPVVVREVSAHVVRAVPVDELELERVVRELQRVRGGVERVVIRLLDVLGAGELRGFASHLGVHAQAAARGVHLGLSLVPRRAVVRQSAHIAREVRVVALVGDRLGGVALVREDGLGVELGGGAGTHRERSRTASVRRA